MYKLSFLVGNTIKTFSVSGRCLYDALQEHCNECIESNIIGIYFKIKNVSNEHVISKHFHIVHTKHGDYGVMIHNLEIIDENRSKASLLLKAKRELLGLSLPQFGKLCKTLTYKSHESNNRQMSLFDFLWYWKVLNCYENDMEIPEKSLNFTGDLNSAGEMLSQLVPADILRKIGK